MLAAVVETGGVQREVCSEILPVEICDPWIGVAALIVIGLQLAAVHVPALARVLGNHPLDAGDWGAVAIAATAPLLAGQVWRWWRARGMIDTPHA